ncbi:reticulon-like protein B21 isoform X4 [Zea mays]|uniref:Reticulon-like protein n=1 Tax=Zea mays TaxID=4577 RepID=A0A1D6Q053_MAIZE|nr:reticulon-like protein B21 isoform X4 [Zea mays]AQK52033.1 Reticulon-like protein B21 [Zea mays]|eukprot:XP_020408143.1 reticulon-like protein B21 isoform X2 [Zea mays]
MQPGGAASSTATGGRRRVSVQSTRSAGATPASSVWEARMKMDEVRGGVKVFSAGAADEPADEEGVRVYRRLRRNQSEGGGAGAADTAAKKRRSWKASKPVTAIGDLRKSRSDAAAAVTTATTTATAVVARRAVARVSMPEKKVAPAPAAAAGEVKEVVVVEVHKAAAADAKNVARGPDEELDDDDDDHDDGAEGELLDEEQETDEEEEKEMLDLQDHMAIDDDEQTAPHQVDDDDEQDLEPPTKGIKPTLSVEEERATNPEPVKPPPPGKKLASVVDLRAVNPEPMTPAPPPVEKKATPIVVHRMTNFELAQSFPEKKALPAVGPRIPKTEPASSPPGGEEYEEIQGRPSQPSRSQARMQNIVNLVMWTDVSKSALVFGLGTFLLVSSSYAKDLNFNTITAASYAGLIYLGLRFLRKSILSRGESVECDDDGGVGGDRCCYLVGEEDAVWLLRLVLPYVNEVLLNLRSLFSGEPATTMKLALILFAMARCGNFVTLWTLAKLVFFGVFIIPKVCSSYSTQLARYGRFWLERLRDAWESCTHKKAVVAAAFTLVWNVSSTASRVWAVFMLAVAVKCYHQRVGEFGWSSSSAGAQEQPADDDDEPPPPPPKHRAQDESSSPRQEFGAPPRHRRAPVSGEFARERLRARGGIQPR